MTDSDFPVLIVGGSLVGLSAATLLAQLGISSLTVERHSGTAIHPRAAHASQRTLEVFRSVGLEGPVCERSAQQFVQNGGIVAVKTLAGGTIQEFIADLNAGVRDVSPSERVFLSQNALEPLLAQRANELGATLRFSTDVVSVEEKTDGVTTQLRDRRTGEISTVRSRYLIAADGAHSAVRRGLGIGMRGRPAFSKSITIYFRANLRSQLTGKQWAVVYVNNEHLRGFFRFEKPFESAFLVVNTVGDPDRPITDVSTNLTDDRARELVHHALGSHDIPVSVDAVMHWDAAAQVAEKLQTARVFIAGDAAHVMPPTGGFGGNTGVQDAHNLAWKLAMVLNGQAAPALLASYQSERLPVARFTAEQAYTRYVLRTDPTLGRDRCQPLIDDLGIELGYVYRSDAVLPDAPDDGALYMSPRASLGRPGTRAPHLWLDRGGKRISSLDLYGRSFVLLCGPTASDWYRHAREIAGELKGNTLEVLQPGSGDLSDSGDNLPQLHGIAPDGCVLVRPDGFVAWRARDGSGASAQQLRTVLSRVLG
jgi:2-polyprenyl-6-methoxyphenol hydroxylase-like FAD-dependent oxidoreductase